jgi:MFS transporter, DHA1 family, inner membrane transport protein
VIKIFFTKIFNFYLPLSMISNEKRLLLILASVNFTHIMDFMIMMPLGPQLIELFHITPQYFAWAVSAYSLTAGISGFVAAFFVDRFDRQKVLFFAYIGFLLGTFACAFAPNYLFLVAARILAGLFGGVIGAQVLSIVGDVIPYERRASAMGLLMTAFSVASVAGVPIGLWLAAHYNWHVPFLAIGGLGILVALGIYFFVPPVNEHLQNQTKKQNPLHILVDILKSRNQMLALCLSTVMSLGPFISPSLVANVGFSQKNIFLIYLVGGLLTIFTSPLVGKLADKKGKFPILLIFGLASLIPVWLITNLWQVPLWVILSISTIFFVTVNGRMIPMQAIVSGVVTPQQRGGFMSINSSVQQLASGAGATIAGSIVYTSADGHFENYAYVGYFSIGMILIALFLGKKVKPNAS